MIFEHTPKSEVEVTSIELNLRAPYLIFEGLSAPHVFLHELHQGSVDRIVLTRNHVKANICLIELQAP